MSDEKKPARGTAAAVLPALTGTGVGKVEPSRIEIPRKGKSVGRRVRKDDCDEDDQWR